MNGKQQMWLHPGHHKQSRHHAIQDKGVCRPELLTLDLILGLELLHQQTLSLP